MDIDINLEPAPDPSIFKLSPELLLCVTDLLSTAQGAALFLTCKRFYPLIHRMRWRRLVRNVADHGSNNNGGGNLDSLWDGNNNGNNDDDRSSWNNHTPSVWSSDVFPWRTEAFIAAAAAARDRRRGRDATGDPDDDLMELLLLLERDIPGHFACMTGCRRLHRYDPRRDRAFTCPHEPRLCEEAECTAFVTGYVGLLVFIFIGVICIYYIGRFEDQFPSPAPPAPPPL